MELTNAEIVSAWTAVLVLQASPSPTTGKFRLRLARLAQVLGAQVQLMQEIAHQLRAEHFLQDPTGRSYVAAEAEILADTVDLTLPLLNEADIESLEVSGSIAGILPLLETAS